MLKCVAGNLDEGLVTLGVDKFHLGIFQVLSLERRWEKAFVPRYVVKFGAGVRLVIFGGAPENG